MTAEDRVAVDPNAISSVPTARPYVAITFDDGPDPDFTPAVLEILRRYSARATFFVVGRNAAAHPRLIAQIRSCGHALANHTENHRWLNELNRREVTSELVLGHRHVAGAAGADLYRPPRGWTSPVVASAAAQLGIKPVFWTDCLEAHLEDGARQAGRSVAGDALPGSILLAHDGGTIAGPNAQHIDRSRSVMALPYLLEMLATRSLVPVTLPTLLANASH